MNTHHQKQHKPPNKSFNQVSITGDQDEMVKKAFITGDQDEMVKKAEDIAKETLEKVETHQVRNFFSLVNEIKMDKKKNHSFEEIKRKVILLKPMLAYAAGRMKGDLKKFYKEIEPELDALIVAKDETQFYKYLDRFFDFSTSIVAYHKFYSK